MTEDFIKPTEDFVLWRKIDWIPFVIYYSVSSDGKVRNDRTGTMLSFYKVNGYNKVDLYRLDGEKVKYRVHRLVLEAFRGMFPDGEETDHINNIRDDNDLWNLHTMTHLKNVRKSKNIPVVQLTLDGKFVARWECGNDTRRYGYNVAHVNECCTGKHKTHHGYRWQYESDYINS